MSIEHWLDLITKVGWPVVAFVGLAYFLARHVWPFVLKQIEVAQVTRQAEMKEFLEALRRRDTLAEQTQKEIIEALHRITSEVALLRSEMRGKL